MSIKFSRIYIELVGISLLILGHVGTALATNATTVQVQNPYSFVIPGQPNAAAFMQLHNPSSQPATLVAASSPAVKAVELHTHTMQNGMMRMRRVAEIVIPAGKTVTLKPGGLHIMLIGVDPTQVMPGKSITITLNYKDKTQQIIQLQVHNRVNQHKMPHTHKHHHH